MTYLEGGPRIQWQERLHSRTGSFVCSPPTATVGHDINSMASHLVVSHPRVPESHFRAQRRHHNSLQPISMLPPEVLLEVIKDVFCNLYRCHDPSQSPGSYRL